MRVAILSSRRAPGAAYLLRDPERGADYEIVAFIASDPENVDLTRFAAATVPTFVHDIRAFYAARGARLTNLDVRPEYDRELARRLEALDVDLLVLCGYLHILTAPVLDAFPGRVLNIHDADLAILDADGRPRYRGLRSTRDAVFAGEPTTRSTVHVVTAEVDVGPVLLRSRPFPVHARVTDARRAGAADILKVYAYQQREWMMQECWGALLSQAIGLVAGRRAGEPELAGAPAGGR